MLLWSVSLLMLGTLTGVRSGWVHPPSITIDEVVEMLNDLTNATEGLFEDMSCASTLCQVGANRIKAIEDVRLPAIRLDDSQQDALIADCKAQEKELQHKVDEALAISWGTKNLTQSTAEYIAFLILFIEGIEQSNERQTNETGELEEEIEECKEELLEDLHYSLQSLVSDLGDVNANVTLIENFVNSRKCEYGIVAVCPGEPEQVDFKIDFTVTPNVAIAIVGFSAHLDGQLSYGSNHPDILGLQKDAFDVTRWGFTTNITDNSSGRVLLKHVYCNWMACQNLDVNPPIID